MRVRCLISGLITLCYAQSVEHSLDIDIATGPQEEERPTNVTGWLRKENVYLESIETVYLANLKIGSPGKTFRVIVDTGSCELWVPEERCHSQGCLYKQTYSINESETGAGPLRDFRLNYLDSKLEGRLYRDQIRVNGIILPDIVFGGATQVDGSSMLGGQFDGIMGLCPRGSRWGEDTFLERLYNSGVVSNLQFSIWLPSNLYGKGKLTLGRVATEFADTEIHWLDIAPYNTWTLDLASFRIDGVELASRDSSVTFDSGTTNIIIPRRPFHRLHRILGAWYNSDLDELQVDCEEVWRMPVIYITIGNLKVSLPPEQYIYPHKEGCFSLFEPGDIKGHGGREIWLLGLPFLRSYFTAFDVAKGRIGFANPKSRRQHGRPEYCKVPPS